jgi:hypothetical protein
MPAAEIVPALVELEVAVPRSTPAVGQGLGVRQDTPAEKGPPEQELPEEDAATSSEAVVPPLDAATIAMTEVADSAREGLLALASPPACR